MGRNIDAGNTSLPTAYPDKEVEKSIREMLQSGMDTFAVLQAAIEAFHLRDCSLLGDLIIQYKKAQGQI